MGHNLDSEGLCEGAIAAQLEHDIQTKALPLLDRLKWLGSHPEPVKLALLNLAFNMGVEGLLKFTTFLGLIQRGAYLEAAQDLLGTKYASQVPNRAKRLAELLKSVV